MPLSAKQHQSLAPIPLPHHKIQSYQTRSGKKATFSDVSWPRVLTDDGIWDMVLILPLTELLKYPGIGLHSHYGALCPYLQNKPPPLMEISNVQ